MDRVGSAGNPALFTKLADLLIDPGSEMQSPINQADLNHSQEFSAHSASEDFLLTGLCLGSQPSLATWEEGWPGVVAASKN